MVTREEMKEALAERHGRKTQEILARSGAAIAGLGGLGSNIAFSLARTGIGYLHLIDFDRVDITNLNRQQYFIHQIGMEKTEALKENLLQINPYLEIRTDCVKVEEGNIRRLLAEDRYICEAFDKAENKAMLVNGVLEHFPEKYLVAASGMAGSMPAASEVEEVSSEVRVLPGEEGVIMPIDQGSLEEMKTGSYKFAANISSVDTKKRQMTLTVYGYDAYRAEDVDALVELISEVQSSTADAVRLGKEQVPIEIIKERFRQLTQMHVAYILDSLRTTTTQINNIKAYLLTALYNAPTTMGFFYSAQVQHDFGRK